MPIPVNDQFSASVAGIIKGIIEHGDKFRHFGSTMSGTYWVAAAVKAGFITESEVITDKGIAWYKQHRMSELKDCRAYFWPLKDWSFNATHLVNDDEA